MAKVGQAVVSSCKVTRRGEEQHQCTSNGRLARLIFKRLAVATVLYGVFNSTQLADFMTRRVCLRCLQSPAPSAASTGECLFAHEQALHMPACLQHASGCLRQPQFASLQLVTRGPLGCKGGTAPLSWPLHDSLIIMPALLLLLLCAGCSGRTCQRWST